MSDRRVDLKDYWYNEKDCLGAGSFGEVYKGHSQKHSNQSFAIKRIRKDRIDKREIQILQELSAPAVRNSNLVKFEEYVEDKDGVYAYLVMEFCNGGDLAKYLKEKKTMDEKSLKVFLQQLVPGMKVLYDHNVVHRDLKPENILLSHSGAHDISEITFKIADFGVGRFLSAGSMAETYCGTPAFMAPELFVPNPKYDYKVDLWSIGAIIYNCITGHVLDKFKQPITFPEHISPSLKDLLAKLLCMEPDKRISFDDFRKHPFIGLAEKQKVVEHCVISTPTVRIPLKQDYTPHPERHYTVAIDNKPPETFKLASVEDSANTPKPSSLMATPKPFNDLKVFQHVDEHAIEVSKTEHKGFRNLVWHLIYARNITNELEKARAIFSWLCCIDLTKLRFDDVQENSPEDFLLRLQRRKTTYAEVFAKLCGYAGLHCKTLSGYAKGSSFKIGAKFTGHQSTHSWNAVYVDGSWRLVDCTWAARKYVDKAVTAKNISYELNEYYFMPEPQQFIFTHFPDVPEWQLLAKPITLADFENLVFVASTFFKYGLQILSHGDAEIHARHEEHIRIGCPKFKKQSILFSYALTRDNGKEDFQGVKLDRYGMHQFSDDEAIFSIRLPEKGAYRLVIYAKHPDPLMDHGKYVNVCEYRILCESNPVRQMPFPPVDQTSWGARECAAKYGLVPLQKGTIFRTAEGVVELRVRAPKDLNFAAKMKSNEGDERALSGYVMHRKVGDEALFTVRTPSKGEFGLEIWVSDPEVDGNSLYHAYQYLIVCNEIILKSSVLKLPTLPYGFLGQQPTFKKLGLSTVSHADPFIQTDSNAVKVEFRAGKPTRMSARLMYESGSTSDDTSQYVLQQTKADNVIFLLNLPKSGFYKLQIYALPQSDESPNLPGVFNYLINCTSRPGSSAVPYPDQSGKWKEGCYLHEPLEGKLLRHSAFKGTDTRSWIVRFKVDVPKARSVAVVVDETDWTKLDQKPSGSWEGDVNLEKRFSKVTVCANYSDKEGNYSVLLNYSD